MVFVAQAESVATDAVVAVESKQDDLDKLHARCKQLLGSAPSNQQVVELQSQLSTEQVTVETLSWIAGTLTYWATRRTYDNSYPAKLLS